MPTTIDELTIALRAGAKAFLAALDGGQPDAGSAQPSEPRLYDPLFDAPPLPCDPIGSVNEQKMASLAYLGAIGRINAEKQRGARADEVAHYARVAGYPDGRAVSGWNSRGDSERPITNHVGQPGERVLNEQGHDSVRRLAEELGLELTGSMTPFPIPDTTDDDTAKDDA